MIDRVHIGRALDCLLPYQVQILNRLLGVAAATIVMREITVMIFELGAVKSFPSPARFFRAGLCVVLGVQSRRPLLG